MEKKNQSLNSPASISSLSIIENFITDLSEGRYHHLDVLPDDTNLRSLAEKLNSLSFSLKEKAREQDEAQRIAKIGNWTFNIPTGKIFWSKELFNLHPVSSQTEPPDFAGLCEMVHVDDRALFQSKVEQCALHGTPYHSLHRLIFPDKVVWLDAYGYAQKDSSGKVINLYGTAQDVTEQIEREELSRFVLEAVKIGIWKFNPNDQSLFWDQSMYDIFDSNPNDFSGHYHAWESSLTPETRSQAVTELNMALSGEKEFDTFFEINTKNRGRRYISGRGKVVRDNSGKALMMYGVNIDITNQKISELEREKVSKFLEVVLQNIPSMIFAKDCQNHLTFSMLNKAGESILGMKASEFIGKNDYDFFNKEIADAVRASDQEAILTGKALAARNVIMETPNGQKTLRTVKFPIYDESNNPSYVIGISNDITEELKIKASLEAERTKSFRNAKLASLGELSAGIAHEINNPLTIIASSIASLEKTDSSPEKYAKKITMIKNATNRINRIVQGLKKFSRSDLKSHRQNYFLKDIISDSLVLTEAKAKTYSVEISIVNSSQVQIHCDEIEIEQVVVNLINNAIDAIKNLNEKWIKITINEEAEFVNLQIMDSGPGIPKDIQEKLFEPFFTTKFTGEGTGLGLSITKGILDEHNARISVLENVPNTCFEILFPKIKS